MTRKDYELLAEALAQAYNLSSNIVGTKQSGVTLAITCVSEALERDNRSFSHDQFINSIANHMTVRHDNDKRLDEAIKLLESSGYEVKVAMPDMEG
jgi:DNA repair ATPase RecN